MPHKSSKDGYLSVTEILSIAIDKPFLRTWYGKYGTQHCEMVKRQSQDLGIAVHKEIEDRFLSSTVGSTDPNVVRMVNNFWREFVEKHGVEVLVAEPADALESGALKFQGTFDAVIRTSKGVFMADWKTSNTLDKVSVPLQLSAYAYLFNHNKQVNLSQLYITQGMAVRIDKEKDKIEIKTYENLGRYFPKFLAALEVARFVKYGLEDERG